MTSHYVAVLGRELHYTEWGRGNRETIVMWQAMKARGPRARVEEIAGCGHAPALNVPGQIALVEAFLAG